MVRVKGKINRGLTDIVSIGKIFDPMAQGETLSASSESVLLVMFPELIISIIDELAAPDFPLAYGYPPIVLRTLLNLALVSQAVSSWTFPFIYAHIRIRSRELPLLHRTLCPKYSIRHRVKSFAIIEPRRTVGRYIYDSDFDQTLSREEVQYICDLLGAMSSSLRRLALDLPYTSSGSHKLMRYTLLGEALLHLPRIIEFVSIRDNLFSCGHHNKVDYSVFRAWKSLSRLSLFDPKCVDVEFIKMCNKLPQLQHLVLVSRNRSLTRILPMSLDLQIGTPRENLKDTAAIIKNRGNILFNLDSIRYDNTGHGTLCWYRSLTERGILWVGRLHCFLERPFDRYTGENISVERLYGSSWGKALQQLLELGYFPTH